MKISAFALVLLAGTITAKADGTVQICGNLETTNYSLPGAPSKVGWARFKSSPDLFVELKIIQGQWDIIKGNAKYPSSKIDAKCTVTMINSISGLDMKFLILCPDSIETALFYIRGGEEKYISTILDTSLQTAAIIIGDCKPPK